MNEQTPPTRFDTSADDPFLRDDLPTTVGELEELLSSLESDLEDLEEERSFVLGQTGVHLSMSTVRQYEDEINALKTRIEKVRKALNSRRSSL